MKKIDTHHHLWEFSLEEYAWMGNDGLEPLRETFLPPDLKERMDASGIDGAVVVQVRQHPKENDWMLELAEANDFMLGVVGWAPLTEPDVDAELERCAARKKFKGVRHIVQDEPDDEYLLRDDFNRGVARLRHHNLIYDILIFEKHLKATIEFVDKHPEQGFVLNHIAKPRIKDGAMQPWKDLMFELGKRDNVIACKLSAVATEADHKDWTEEQLQPYMEVGLESFGVARLMFGSDWPVSLLATNYKEWHDIVERFVNRQLSENERDHFWHKNAERAYNL